MSKGHVASKWGGGHRLSDSTHHEPVSWVHPGAAAGIPQVAQEGTVHQQ